MTLLRTTVAAAALVAAMGLALPAQAGRAYVGTYTADPSDPRSAANSHGEGIYLLNIDDATGAPSSLKLVAKMLSPSWITLSADHKFLYAVSEVASYGSDKHGSVTAFAVEANGTLKPLNTVDSGGAIPCFISVHPSGKFVMVANYTGGSYEIIRLKADGSLGEDSGVEPGDVITDLGGYSSFSLDQLRTVLSAGRPITLGVRRGSEQLRVSLSLGDLAA